VADMVEDSLEVKMFSLVVCLSVCVCPVSFKAKW